MDILTKTYMISNAHLDATAYDENAGCTWVLFVEGQVIESGFDKPDVSTIEIYKYIDGSSGTQTSSRIVSLLEARAEWKFWIGQGFQRITDKESKGWKYTGEIRDRAGINKLAKAVTSGMRRPRFVRHPDIHREIAAEVGEINERETA